MQLKLSKPKLERFIAQRVQAGDFPSPEAVVEDALIRMMEEDIALTDADVDAINASEEQIDRGEFIEFDSFAAEMRRKFGKS